MTPEAQGSALAELGESKGLDPSVMAHDAANAENISTRNIMQLYLQSPDGSVKSARGGAMAALRSAAASAQYRISKDGISDERVLQLWWMLERRKPGVLPALVKAAKKSDEANALLVTVEQRYAKGAAELLAAEPNFTTFEAIEAWLVEHEGLDTKELAKHLKGMTRDEQIKQELKARGAWQKCQEMLSSGREKDMEAAKAGLQQLAEAMPDTVYGQRAAGG